MGRLVNADLVDVRPVIAERVQVLDRHGEQLDGPDLAVVATSHEARLVPVVTDNSRHPSASRRALAAAASSGSDQAGGSRWPTVAPSSWASAYTSARVVSSSKPKTGENDCWIVAAKRSEAPGILPTPGIDRTTTRAIRPDTDSIAARIRDRSTGSGVTAGVGGGDSIGALSGDSIMVVCLPRLDRQRDPLAGDVGGLDRGPQERDAAEDPAGQRVLEGDDRHERLDDRPDAFGRDFPDPPGRPPGDPAQEPGRDRRQAVGGRDARRQELRGAGRIQGAGVDRRLCTGIRRRRPGRRPFGWPRALFYAELERGRPTRRRRDVSGSEKGSDTGGPPRAGSGVGAGAGGGSAGAGGRLRGVRPFARLARIRAACSGSAQRSAIRWARTVDLTREVVMRSGRTPRRR